MNRMSLGTDDVRQVIRLDLTDYDVGSRTTITTYVADCSCRESRFAKVLRIQTATKSAVNTFTAIDKAYRPAPALLAVF